MQGRRLSSFPGDLLAIFDGPRRSIQCACNLVCAAGELGMPMRVGLHTGEVDLTAERGRGVALKVSEQVAAQADIGEVLVSSTVRDLIAGSGFEFQPRGYQLFESVGGELRLFAVELPASSTLTEAPR